MTNKTKVIFRKFKSDDSVIALFPEIINYPNGNCESYMHIGQHGAADYNGLLSVTKLTTPVEHRALRQELENMGYELDVRKKRNA